jgi:hypothetical protein
MNRKTKEAADASPPAMDDVLKRMLSTAPKPHKDEKAKPAQKPAKNKPAK